MSSLCNGKLGGALDCYICMLAFDDEYKLPRTLSCGHTFCSTCLMELVPDAIPLICPRCRVNHGNEISGVNDIPIAQTVLDIVEAIKKFEANHVVGPERLSNKEDFPLPIPGKEPKIHKGFCEDHAYYRVFYCSDHNEYICYQCTVVDHPVTKCTMVKLESALLSRAELEDQRAEMDLEHIGTYVQDIDTMVAEIDLREVAIMEELSQIRERKLQGIEFKNQALEQKHVLMEIRADAKKVEEFDALRNITDRRLKVIRELLEGNTISANYKKVLLAQMLVGMFEKMHDERKSRSVFVQLEEKEMDIQDKPEGECEAEEHECEEAEEHECEEAEEHECEEAEEHEFEAEEHECEGEEHESVAKEHEGEDHEEVVEDDKSIKEILVKRGSRFARLTQEDGKILLHCFGQLTKDSALENAEIASYGFSLVGDNYGTAFLDLEVENEDGEVHLSGRVLIRTYEGSLRGRHFLLLCTGECPGGATYKGSRFIGVGSKGEKGEYIHGGDYEFSDASGGKSVMHGIECHEDIQRPWKMGVVGAWSEEERMSGQFAINTEDGNGDINMCLGEVVEGMLFLKQVIDLCDDVMRCRIADCGIVVNTNN